MADSVEKHTVSVAIMAAVGRLARGDFLDMPSSVQMMDFVG